MTEPSHRILSFLGTDNTSDASDLQIRKNGGIFLREFLNVDIDDEYMAHRRRGYGAAPVVSSTTIHSIWSDSNTFLYVDSTSFKKLNKDLSVTTLITGIDPDDRMAYVAVNDKIFFSNNSIVGYVQNGLSYSFSDPDQAFKTRMVGGQILEYFNSRLYAANGHILYYSDATVLTRMDKRKNAKAFPDRITMVKAVADGMYVSSAGKTFFMKGSDPDDFILMQVLDSAAIEGTAITLDGNDIGRGISGRAIYFLTPSGPYKGYPGGVAIERQGGLFELKDDVARGTSILRTDNGYQQYLAIYELIAGTGGASGSIEVPRVIVAS